MTYKETFNKIITSFLFRLDGADIDVTQSLTDLGNQVAATEDVEWALGEFGECMLGDLIVGAYWCLTEWHGGQSSKTYAAMCSLGRVFSPGVANGPEPDTGEVIAYDIISEHYKTQNK